jgi:hypothetical protein
VVPRQFSLRTLLAIAAWVAFMLSWTSSWRLCFEDCYPVCLWPGKFDLLASGLLVWAGVGLLWNRERSGAVILVVAAWQLMCLDLTMGLIDGLDSTCVESPGRYREREIWQHVIYAALPAVTLPLFVTVPVAYTIVVYGRGTLSPTARWLLYSLAAPLADVTLLIRLVSSTFGTWLR